MQTLKYHYHNTIETDLILTENIKSSLSLPKFKKIIISTGGANLGEHYITSSLFILDCVSGQKPILTCRRDKKSSLVVGGKVTLRKSMMFLFLFKMLFEILPVIKGFEGFKYPQHKDAFIFTVKDIFLFPSLAPMVSALDNSTCFIKIHVLTTSSNNHQLFKLGRLSLICFL